MAHSRQNSLISLPNEAFLYQSNPFPPKMQSASGLFLTAIAMMCMFGLSAAWCDSLGDSKTSAISTIRVKVPTKAFNAHDYHTRQVKFRDEIAHVDWSLDLQAVAFRQLRRIDSKKIPSDNLPLSASVLLNATCLAPCEFKEARLVKLTHDGIQAFEFNRFPSNQQVKAHYVARYSPKGGFQSEFETVVCPDCSMTLELDYRKVTDIDLTIAPHEERQTIMANDFSSK